jgi:hypothetical protein
METYAPPPELGGIHKDICARICRLFDRSFNWLSLTEQKIQEAEPKEVGLFAGRPEVDNANSGKPECASFSLNARQQTSSASVAL